MNENTHIWTWLRKVYKNGKPVTMTFVKLEVYCSPTFCFVTTKPLHLSPQELNNE
jgi:hypothetical protein